MEFSTFSSLTLARFESKTRMRLEKFMYNFDSCISNQKVFFIPLKNKKTLMLPKQCSNCLSPTGSSIEIRDSRYVEQTIKKDVIEVFTLEIPLCEECKKKMTNYSLEYPKKLRGRMFHRKTLVAFLTFLGIASFIFSLILVSRGSENIITFTIGKKYNLIGILSFMGIVPLLLFYIAKIHGYKLQGFVKEYDGFKIPNEIVSIASVSFLHEDKGILFNNEKYADLFCKSNNLQITEKKKIVHIMGHTYEFIPESK